MMSPPLLGVEGDGQGQENGALLTERNYLGLSSVDNTAVSGIDLNLKATELRLGLPGSQSPARDQDKDNIDEKQLFPLLPSKDGICSASQKNVVSGSKRGFAYTIEGNWMFGLSGTDPDVQKKFTSNANVNVKMSSGAQPAVTIDAASKVPQSLNKANGSGSCSNPPAAKAQVDRNPGVSPFFVKVSMDGTPYLRKDRRSSITYQELSLALEKMFKS